MYDVREMLEGLCVRLAVERTKAQSWQDLVRLFGKPMERLIADGRFVIQEDGVAEFAMLVADAWQGKGVGRRLFATLVRAARAVGAREIFGEVLSMNRRMIALARDAGFHVASVPGDATVCTVRLPLETSPVPAPRASLPFPLAAAV
jgi:acetyltransferase